MQSCKERPQSLTKSMKIQGQLSRISKTDIEKCSKDPVLLTKLKEVTRIWRFLLWSTFDLQPSTFNLRPSTFNLRPSTFDLQPLKTEFQRCVQRKTSGCWKKPIFPLFGCSWCSQWNARSLFLIFGMIHPHVTLLRNPGWFTTQGCVFVLISYT